MQPDESSELWFAAAGGRRYGPFAHADLQMRLSNGELDSGSLVWRRGLSRWEPASGHFALSSSTASSSAQGAPARGDDQAQAPRRSRSWLALVLLVPAGILYALLLYGDGYANFGRLGGALHAASWLAALALAGASCVFAWKPWRAKAPAGTSDSGVKLAAALAGVIAVCLSVFFAGVTPHVARIANARAAYAAFTLRYDPVTRTIRFSGTIGPRFAERLASMIETHSGVAMIEVDSPGGLIDEAQRAATLLERRPEIAVAIARECNSACVLLFMAAARRFADVGSSAGIHSVSPITDVPGFAKAGFDGQVESARQYLSRRGMPEDVLLEADALKHDELRQVDALELLDRRLVEGVTREGEIVQPDEARWLWLSHMLAASGTDPGFAEVALAVAESDNADLLSRSGAIYDAVRSGQAPTVKATLRDFIAGLLPRLLESADPAAAAEYVRASFGVSDYLATAESWSECGALFDGKGLTDWRSIPRSVVAAEYAALAAAIRSADAAKWVERPIPSWAASEGQRVLSAAVARAGRRGANVARPPEDDRSKCLVLQEFGRSSGTLEPVRAVAVWRALNVQKARQEH